MNENDVSYRYLIRELKNKTRLISLAGDLKCWGGIDNNYLILEPLYLEYEAMCRDCSMDMSLQPLHYPVLFHSGSGLYSKMNNLVLFPKRMMVPPPISDLPDVSFEFVDAWERRLNLVLPILAPLTRSLARETINEMLQNSQVMRQAILRNISLHEQGHTCGKLPIFIKIGDEIKSRRLPRSPWANAIGDVAADLFALKTSPESCTSMLVTLSYHLFNLRYFSSKMMQSPDKLIDPDIIGGILIWRYIACGENKVSLDMRYLPENLQRLDSLVDQLTPGVLVGDFREIQQVVTQSLPKSLSDLICRVQQTLMGGMK